MNDINIAVLGKGIVGKNILIYKYMHYYELSGVKEITLEDIEDKYQINITINNKPFNINILDTAGEEDYQNMIDICISFGEGFLLVFAIEDKKSFEVLKGRRERVIKGKKRDDIPIILVGNKINLNEERQVTFEEATKLANSWGSEYIEITTNFNCKEAFEKLIIKIISQSKKTKNYFTKNIPKISYPGIDEKKYILTSDKNFYLKLKVYENYWLFQIILYDFILLLLLFLLFLILNKI